eukprot:g684.t1
MSASREELIRYRGAGEDGGGEEASGKTLAKARRKLRKRLVRFYRKYCPDKLKNRKMIDKIAHRFAGKTKQVKDELFDKLVQKYRGDSASQKKKNKHERKRDDSDDESSDEHIPDILRPPETASMAEKKENKTKGRDGEQNPKKKRRRDDPAPVAGTAEKKTKPEAAKKRKHLEKADKAASSKKGPQLVRLPSGVHYIDVQQAGGNGPRATRNQLITIRYKGFLVKNNGDAGAMFDKGILTFTLGAGEVIKGFDIGIVGMRPSGVRRILIPSMLGYGARGAPPQIPPYADLIFEVTLVRIGSRRAGVRSEKDAARRWHNGKGSKSHGKSHGKKKGGGRRGRF